ncbi:hypothetical protein HCB33_01345 [Listeria sp. FSL L7-0233]|uniref:DUF4352 domain-containing protein n=1 Tax=Listeria cossartiae TaxID=2838249 RepID=UPI001627C33B|nr:DUF4352 domain-containing protein [Listeria cossartiae]MBC1543916.1 hypothetical protein [Listeria cossartiae subsp. cossartiae]MBC1548581.1 hypothetical protein [Listeria cossartiae subsp. cossartiae]MBC2181996.1 hypothetical protein [Listeria cossartiae subsp. cossartiae]MBC2186765.1 hypothetical protein [Listeria cossartiae subsp. cossartiae]MBC2192869.1 hypothetical protein [Listeria cossartiae subsp. cossartiae]
MEIWIIAGICAFLIFIAGIVILFFPAKRKIGAILTSAGTLLMIGSIIGIIVSFSHYQQVQNDVFNYSSKGTSQTTPEETKTYQVNYEDSADNIKKKISTITVEKKETYSTLESKSVEGSITIALEITNNASKILETYPNQGQLEANDLDLNGGDAMLSNFDTTEIKPGETAKGKIVFPVDKLDKVSDITWVSYSFLSYLKDSTTPITTETGKIELK